jgi:hypothetical protein
LDEALSSYDRAISLNPNYAEAYSNRGIILQYFNRFDEALMDYNHAIALKPDYYEAYFNKSLLKIIKGDYLEGWKLYEWRWKKSDFNLFLFLTDKPKFSLGKSKRVLVWPEQGLGDVLMFTSLLSEFKELCSKLIVQVDARIISLLSRSQKKDITFIPMNEYVNEDEYDEHIPIGGLCQYLRNDEESFKKTRNGWLLDDKVRTAIIKKELLHRSNSGYHKKICGISWRSKGKETSANRSLDLKSFIGMLALEGYVYVSLQYGDTSEEISIVRDELGVDIISYEEIDNFMDIDGVACLIQACDVVVSIDNTTVHLAGALGKDVRVLLPYLTGCRWSVDGYDCPWYASVLLYRQNSDYQWDPVFKQIREGLIVSK